MASHSGLNQQETERRVLEFTPTVIARNAILVALALAAAAQISVPLSGLAAPFTLQSLTVVLAGPIVVPAPELGVALTCVWAALACPYSPMLRSGAAALTGPTAGFLWVFLLIPTPLAHLARRVDGSWSGVWFSSFLAAHGALLLLGFLWFALPARNFEAFVAWGAPCRASCSKACWGSSSCASCRRT